MRDNINQAYIDEQYKTGYISQGEKKVAAVYSVPASTKMADKYNIARDMDNPAVWQIRITCEEMTIHYETTPKGYQYTVLMKAEDGVYNDAVEDIKQTIRETAA